MICCVKVEKAQRKVKSSRFLWMRFQYSRSTRSPQFAVSRIPTSVFKKSLFAGTISRQILKLLAVICSSNSSVLVLDYARADIGTVFSSAALSSLFINALYTVSLTPYILSLDMTLSLLRFQAWLKTFNLVIISPFLTSCVQQKTNAVVYGSYLMRMNMRAWVTGYKDEKGWKAAQSFLELNKFFGWMTQPAKNDAGNDLSISNLGR
uniref:Uncharacterized protein n=1 Tax=Glossina palpalis gambiensis TaxID=67801 RepID=A0A1B0BYZ1_9MUSC